MKGYGLGDRRIRQPCHSGISILTHSFPSNNQQLKIDLVIADPIPPAQDDFHTRSLSFAERLDATL
jgi:hypothetical protein